MSKKHILKPIEIFRTPEQHRAIIQSVEIPHDKVKLPKFKNKSLGDGTNTLTARMKRLGFQKYTEYLQSRHWLSLKQQWKKSDLYVGRICSTKDCQCTQGLSLHHWTYQNLGNEKLTDLILVCQNCHKQIHRLERNGVSLKEATEFVVGQVMSHGASSSRTITDAKVITGDRTMR